MRTLAIINTLVPYFVLWGGDVLEPGHFLRLTLALAVPTADFLVRAFILIHVAARIVFKSRAANETTGRGRGCAGC